MAFKNPIHLSGASSWSRPKQISAIRSDHEGEPELLSRAPSQECDANASSVALGVLFEPEGSPVAFFVGRESVLDGGSGLQVLSSGAPALAPFPFSWEELVTLVRAAIRRSNVLTDSKVARFGDVRCLCPNDKLENELRKDYAAMKIMFFTEPPSFDVLEAIKQLEDRLNRLGA